MLIVWNSLLYSNADINVIFILFLIYYVIKTNNMNTNNRQ